jgi:[protein-PII] uridylyltransferase
MVVAVEDVGLLETMAPANNRGSTADDGRERIARPLADAQREFVAEIERGRGGAAAHRRFADRMDALVGRAVEDAVDRAAIETPFAICAIGGYGRRSLCLHSDIDLLILFGGRIGRAEERFVNAVLHPLWDARLTVGHQVRTFAEVEELGDDNPEFMLALIDVRRLTGDSVLFEGVHTQYAAEGLLSRRSQIIEALLQLTEARHTSYNDTIYQLEPDIKSSPGGLRDIMAARLLARLTPDASASLEASELESAEDFLLRVRSLLHLEAGRNVNLLSHELQETAADRLRFPGARTEHRVEALMSRFFVHARGVSRTLARVTKASQSDGVPKALAVEPTGPNLELFAGAIRFVDPERASTEPASWLRAFEAALDRQVPVGDEVLAIVERHISTCTFDDVLPTEEDRDRLMRCLRPRKGQYETLSEMHECGLLDRLLPGFAAISCRVIRDFYHKYTVDEHTLLTIRALERLLEPDPSRERFRAVLGELRAPERLVLALLFHDVGKWKMHNHAQESVRLARAMYDRLELDTEFRNDVEFLIGEHLQMSYLAFRRDSEDPLVVQRFAALVGTEERLKMLCLMTLVDIEAVAPGTLTPWKEELLWRLYVDTYNQLTLAYGDDVIEKGQAAVAALQTTRPDDMTEHELSEFLEGFPRRYLAMFDSAHIYQHARLARGLHPDEVHLFLEQKGDVWELAVVTLDKPLLFSNICGTLSYFGVDILRGSAMTSPAGVVLDIFQFSDHGGAFRLNPGALAEFESLLQTVIAGRQDVTTLLQRKESGPLYRRGPRRITPVVYFDDAHSQSYTVLEIVAQDALGLLHRISRMISLHGCDVDLVLISTEGNKAIDVFHLTKGATKVPRDAQLALKQDLERMLEEE